MKRTILIILGVFAMLVLIGVILAYAVQGKDTPPVIATSTTPSLPVAGSTVARPLATITVQGSTTAQTTDFLHNGVTVPDPANPGRYLLAGSTGYCLANGTCPSAASTTDFSISYTTSDSFFNVVLLKEPLGPVREEAQTFLVKTLGIPQTQLCSINYYVGTPYYVNQFYSGTNLGFSFCPGATELPN